MKIILTREVAGLGAPGDIVDVADGYGRNYLVPRGAAINWSKGAEKQITQIKRAQDS
ncbi:MAG: large subunit ribosomal protein, partial [Pseudonocardiales bacterium]|nr:large subunit ribosomal protein [Pseudonocardiales bacterium]